MTEKLSDLEAHILRHGAVLKHALWWTRHPTCNARTGCHIEIRRLKDRGLARTVHVQGHRFIEPTEAGHAALRAYEEEQRVARDAQSLAGKAAAISPDTVPSLTPGTVEGITYRQWLIGQALVGLVAAKGGGAPTYAGTAISVADAVIAALEKEPAALDSTSGGEPKSPRFRVKNGEFAGQTFEARGINFAYQSISALIGPGARGCTTEVFDWSNVEWL